MNTSYVAAVVAWLSLVVYVEAIDRVVMRRDGVEQELVGRIVVRTQDGGVLLETRDGALWGVTADEQASISSDDEAYAPYRADELAAVMLAELPSGFETLQTKHYLICYNTPSSGSTRPATSRSTSSRCSTRVPARSYGW